MKTSIFLAIFLSFVYTSSFAQPFFQRDDNVVVKINGNTLSLSLAGGLNFTQTSNIDLNLDGINDLFVFDRTGNKVRTFLNKGTIGVVDYMYAPQYENRFPSLHDWALLADYNCDGKADIFSYSDLGGGFKVYKNTSSIATGLQFTLVTPLQLSAFNPPSTSLINLYVSSVDIPAISDIDGDGDLDVVTFAITGTYMEYHINKSKELYGTCDSLKFEMKNRCWGYAAENAFTNTFSLHDTCIGNVANPGMIVNTSQERDQERHAGSCELCLDLNGDGDKDFIAGDISYANLTMLTNGGSPTSANFIAVDTAFPSHNSATSAVALSIFPCAFSVDMNTDGKNDLVVSPNAPNASENYTSMVYYENIGTNNFPVFQYQQSDVLQDNMIEVGEGAYPALFDYDNDGLKDLFVGNYGYYGVPNFTNKIALFKNMGTITIPKYELVTRDYNNLSTLGISNMIPTFGDLDGDGDGDMLIGGNDGRLYYFQNTALAGATANFVLVPPYLKNSNNRIIDVGDCAAPHIADIDGDGKEDLVIGSRNGKLAYYHRLNATGIPQLDSVSHFWGNIRVNQYGYVTGYSFPYVFKHAGKTELLVGSELGYLRRYDNITGNITGTFNLVDSTFMSVREGARTAPTGGDINNDGYWDLFVGNYSGGIGFYKGASTSTIMNNINTIDWNFELYPNPANNLLTIQISNETNKMFEITLYSILGQVVHTERNISKTLTINTVSLKQGVYMCKVSELNANGTINSGTLIKRIMIQH